VLYQRLDSRDWKFRRVAELRHNVQSNILIGVRYYPDYWSDLLLSQRIQPPPYFFAFLPLATKSAFDPDEFMNKDDEDFVHKDQENFLTVAQLKGHLERYGPQAGVFAHEGVIVFLDTEEGGTELGRIETPGA
jgi:hypothetical protein